MKYIDLSMENLKNISVCAAKEIAEKNRIDLVVYIAQAGFPVAFYMNTVFQCRLLGIKAVRKGDRMKSILGKTLAYAPKSCKNFLRSIELKLRVHKRHPQRCVAFHTSVQELDQTSSYSVLVVDDSVDTGNSMKQVVETVAQTFPNAEIITYAVNVFDESRALIKVDYFTFQNSVIRTPMSKDSKEYGVFCEMYQRETLNGHI